MVPDTIAIIDSSILPLPDVKVIGQSFMQYTTRPHTVVYAVTLPPQHTQHTQHSRGNNYYNKHVKIHHPTPCPQHRSSLPSTRSHTRGHVRHMTHTSTRHTGWGQCGRSGHTHATRHTVLPPQPCTQVTGHAMHLIATTDLRGSREAGHFTEF